MSCLRDKRSIVGIDPTSYGLAYVAFENGELLDWGNLRRNGEGGELAMLDRIVDGVAADVLVLEEPDAEHCHRHPRIRKLLRDLTRHARRRGIRVIPSTAKTCGRRGDGRALRTRKRWPQGSRRSYRNSLVSSRKRGSTPPMRIIA